MEKTSKNSGKEKSDMLTMLENLERMFVAAQQCVNEYARDALLKALSIEAETLALKVLAMLERWKVFLPFKENSDVEFGIWMRKIDCWIGCLRNVNRDQDYQFPRFVASFPFLLDLYTLQVKRGDFDTSVVKEPIYLRMIVSALQSGERVSLGDTLLINLDIKSLLDIMKNDDGYMDEISLRCMDFLKRSFVEDRCWFYKEMDQEPIAAHERVEILLGSDAVGHDLFKDCSIFALKNLSNALNEIIKFFGESLSSDQFERLTWRVRARHCRGIGRIAIREVNQMRNSWPKISFKVKVLQQLDELRKQLYVKSFGTELEEYINLA